MLMGSDASTVDIKVVRQRNIIHLELGPEFFPGSVGSPSFQPVIDGRIVTEFTREISPGNSSSGDVKNGFDKHSVTLLRRRTDFRFNFESNRF